MRTPPTNTPPTHAPIHSHPWLSTTTDTMPRRRLFPPSQFASLKMVAHIPSVISSEEGDGDANREGLVATRLRVSSGRGGVCLSGSVQGISFRRVWSGISATGLARKNRVRLRAADVPAGLE